MKQIGLIAFIAGLALAFVGLVLQCIPVKIVSAQDHSMYDTYYVVPHVHIFIILGLPMAALGGALVWFQKSAKTDPLRAVSFALLIAAAICTLLGYTQNEAIMRALDDQGAMISFIPLEPAAGAVLGVIGLSLLFLSRLIQMISAASAKAREQRR